MLVICNVYVRMNLRDEILLRGEECKTREKNGILGKNGKMVNCCYSTY